MKKDSFYITTTIPYVNAEPHIGFALELTQADALARYQRLNDREVFFSTGTDEYGQKIWEASIKEGKNVQDYVDHYTQKFLELKGILNLSYDNFIRTTSVGHITAVQEFWRLCNKKGDIYKKIYRGLYCVGCEKFITEKDLKDGFCPLHPNKKPEIVEEENYFFRLSKYKKELLQYLANDKVIFPEWRRKEAIDFVQNGMEDFSISRDKRRFSWGIPIPGDETQVMYVWFGAFVNYISTLGWPNSKGLFDKFWVGGERVQIAGKDMVKFQSVMWQGMLLSAGMPTTDKIIYHGFITGEGGIKMSKSLGNVINPNDIVKEYGTDALRYFLLREISSFEDSPFTMERFKDAYNANLANGLGNLISRVMTMAVTYNVNLSKDELEIKYFDHNSRNYLKDFDINQCLNEIWSKLKSLDEYIQKKEPFKNIKINPKEAKQDVHYLLFHLYSHALELEPFLPETSDKIKKLIRENKKPEKSLFPRKD
ncbi:methionine--tRNA ligase [Candidatus Nomurabacteria bacterium RIFCSPHIGHO2_01_FULL_39_220]|uniref:Methionine--tRNA ligase n=1 Tax=Candidatus Nomurabacteria bacterium RIFCSPLOWO2_02_FULL_40_67 TaxID=1801787 RepID=A0A1F6Y2R4_9BACT|nr:MAG: Methionine-tRNA ligase [Parcubacteria group bacterium GW2011_GWA2_40_37]OGI62460.1 MAG: methionine--tRNA ligase [Candidatus Nomurabacteria bacterium RBG_16_40_11]OGI70704.1 MAG: methionine--tRNA ligase [Candidatus Nomurabacteria bacterium RIFCSPHIGHO2_01_FULL_39_220]OGI72454.1 MAG: methionine--tRNA ligase [Candidatus Nomurabacteria bacterium RIFCSPHIGHO2_02_41_18]OGI78111.1 MAG: methionine--tRNA ligase [Candidatus Nomurabacteria bacterium RIFCSPHIGHO2_02_FULL_41_150]OGI81119.1 MAG: met